MGKIRRRVARRAPAQKKKVVKKSVAKKPALPKPVGAVRHYFRKISVAIVKFKKPVKTGAVLEFRGATTSFSQPVKSMQYDHKSIAIAKPGKEIGIKTKKRVREGDAVYLIT